jgi:hypothetical protein
MGIPTRKRGRLPRLIVGGLLVATLAGMAGNSSTASATSPVLVSSWGASLLAAGVAPAGVTSGTITAMVTPAIQTAGASATPIVVAVAPIDSSGNFALYTNPGTGAMASIVANAIQNNNGWVNFDLQEIGANGTMTLQSVSRQFAGSLNQPVSEGSINSNIANEAKVGTWQGDGAISDGSPITDGSTTVDSSTYVVLRPASTTAASAASTENADALVSAQQLDTTSPNGGGGHGDCLPNTTLQDQQNQDTVIGELHTADNMSAVFTYGKTADTSADVGIEIAGTGEYNVSGSVHIGNGSSSGNSITFPAGTQYGYKLESGFLIQHFYSVVALKCGGNYFTVKEAQWTGEPNPSIVGANIHNLDNQCTTAHKQYAGNWVGVTTWNHTSGSFTHFDTAFSLFGFAGGTRSGASQYVWDHYSFTGTPGPKGTGHWLCGNDAPILASPHRIFAGF